MRAVYDLSRYPANFNFLESLVCSKTMGADHMLLNDSRGYQAKYSATETKKRMSSILEPACALGGMTFSYGDGSGIDPGYHIDAVLSVFEKHGRLAKLETVLPKKDVEYTVTLRNYKRYEHRNSGESWRKFAESIKALVIEDYNDQPIHLHERMALYAGAKMNFFVANGPGALCIFSDYPYIQVMKNIDVAYHKACGYPPGSQYPWRVENQHLVWSDDDLDTLNRTMDSWLGGKL